ncbi:MAG TPA: hypothetical protein DDY17_10885 [Syntrophaceae bacterium]|nr:hypothetical protein [Syntrophaceae bacterium]
MAPPFTHYHIGVIQVPRKIAVKRIPYGPFQVNSEISPFIVVSLIIFFTDTSLSENMFFYL